MTDTHAAKMRTRAIHAGERPDPETGASAPNLVMSSTFLTEPGGLLSAIGMSEEAGHVYTRFSNPTVRQLEQKVAALEDAEACAAFASGMAATTAVFLTFLSAGDHVVIGDTNYAGAAELARDTLPRLGIRTEFVDSSDIGLIARALRPETKMVWVETPANPILRLSDIRGIADLLADFPRVRFAVDSTLATPVSTRPLSLGADLVVHSLTKYIGGHGDAIGGAVAGSKSDIDELRLEAAVHHGGVLSPFNAWLILRGAATLPLRMEAHQEGALRIARFLEDHPETLKVIYPGLESHPQRRLAQRQMSNFSGMISFQARHPDRVLKRIAEEGRSEDGGGALEVIHYAVSLGHHRTLIYWMETESAIETSFRLSNEALRSYRRFAGDGIFRLSVGLEDPADLCEDLDRVLG